MNLRPVLLALLALTPAFASEDLSKQHKCSTCHDAAAKKIGPTWKEIAAKRKGDKATVATAIVKGAKGEYGKVPMPPQPKAAGDADALAAWILTH
jgi:cytochrome c